MRRVCCFCERWESGGIESFLYNVLMRIDLTQFQIDIVVTSLGESIFTNPLLDRGVRFFELSGGQRRVMENHRQFCELLQERRWDVLHLNVFQGLSLSYLHLAKRAGVPVRIAHSHNTALRKSRTRPLKLLLHQWAKERYTGDATELWACSRSAAEFLFSKRELEQRGFRFIPNGIDTARFQFDPKVRGTVRTELGLDGKFVVGNVGRLCYQKNQSFLLDVFAEVIKRNPDSRLLLVGDGKDKDKLREKARRLGIEEKVLFYGVSDHVEQLLWAMDVFVMTSRFEGLPVTAIEAQASGIPCLFADTITMECQTAREAVFLPLESPMLAWADTILHVAAPKCRERGAEEVRGAGFDITDVAALLEHDYMR